MGVFKRIGFWIKNGYYLVFKAPAETQLLIQNYEKKGEESGLNFTSYVALKKYHRKMKLFLFSFFSLGFLVAIAVLICIILILGLFFRILGVENNPFNLSLITRNIMQIF